jgi:hypothetical protein
MAGRSPDRYRSWLIVAKKCWCSATPVMTICMQVDPWGKGKHHAHGCHKNARVAGEPDALKGACPVRREEVEKGPRKVPRWPPTLLKHVLAWVALRSGKSYLEWEETGSTRTCHDCGYVVAGGIPPEIREWDCPRPDCTSHHLRDENAARNGLNRTRKRIGVALLGPSGGLLSACLAVQRTRTHLRGSVTTLKQEPAARKSNQNHDRV